jgi:hypothetical protein
MRHTSKLISNGECITAVYSSLGYAQFNWYMAQLVARARRGKSLIAWTQYNCLLTAGTCAQSTRTYASDHCFTPSRVNNVTLQ